MPALSYLRLQKPKFTVLIGSRARRTQKKESDIDIVRIGHREPVSLDNGSGKKGKDISYIDYDPKKFSELYRNGSLFLYHVFTEGSLLQGSRMGWRILKKGFKVSKDFSEEISQNRKLLYWLQSGEKFKGATIPYLAHTFRALKNLAIFSLAEKSDYIFDKRAALQKAFPKLDREAISVLIDANNVFERSVRNCPSYALGGETIAHVRRQIAHAVDFPRRHAHR
jgi:hypothetical protein